MRYKLNEKEFVFREEESGALLFNRKTSMFYNLNDTASEIIKGITESRTSASILSRLTLKYSAPSSSELIQDYNEFLNHMLMAGVIAIEDSLEELYRGLSIPQDCREVKMEEINFIERNLSHERSMIIDLGCNDGYGIEYFSNKHDIFGLDIDYDSLKKAKEKCRTMLADISFLPVRRGCADIVLLTGHVLGYLKKAARDFALNGIYESVSKNGKFIFGVWTQRALHQDEYDINEVDMIEARDNVGNLYSLHFFSESEIAEIVSSYTIDDVLFLSRNGEFGNEYVAYCCRKE